MARKRITLPKDIDELLERGDLAELTTVFDRCALDATTGSSKSTALAQDACPDDLATWLVAHGADIEFSDLYGRTPLMSRASHGSVAVLLELGADVGATGPQGTALHQAAEAGNVGNVDRLIAAGADVDAHGPKGQTPLEYALKRASNIDIVRLAPVARRLIAAGAEVSTQARDAVRVIGERFEFYRADFNPDSIDEHSSALENLYAAFSVPPVPRRLTYDGVSPIIVGDGAWQESFESLWELLVPGSGPATTVQGEAIRVVGRIGDELHRNGGANWDREDARMRAELERYLVLGTGLTSQTLAELAQLRAILALDLEVADTARMTEIVVAWVRLNPDPLPLASVPYKR